VPDKARLLEAAISAVHQGVAVARANHRMRAVALMKADESPVTAADFAVQAVVVRTLEVELGELSLVAEESATDARADAEIIRMMVESVRLVWPESNEETVLAAIDRGGGEPRAEGFWTLDPIDGTKGYLRGQQYCISLAYIEGGRPIVGVLGCPNLPADRGSSLDQPDPNGSLYWAIEAEGAFDGSGARIEASAPAPDTITFCESVEEAHSDHEGNRRLIASLGVRQARSVRLDSQCKYAVVARGQADAYLRLPKSDSYVEKIWDHAAGSLLASEAGCVVSDVRGEQLDFSLGRRLERNRGVVVATRGLHARLVAALAELG
jgi:3'(2'), 5'-bisphosphate nucleotidase